MGSGKLITLIRPPAVSFTFDLSITYPAPIGLAYISAYLEQFSLDHDIIDAVGIDPKYRSKFKDNVVLHGISLDQCVERVSLNSDIIGISVPFSMHWPSAKYLIKSLRQKFPDALILIGGEHSNAMPEFSLLECPELDLCVLGEGEETFINVIEAFRQKLPFKEVGGIVFRHENEIIKTEKRKRMKDLDKIPWPNWEKLPMANYHKHQLSYGVSQGINMPIMASRGCPYRCTFCSSPNMWGTNWSVRTVDDVINEIIFLQEKYKATDFSFYDLTAIVQKKWIVDFCHKIIEKKLTITWQLPSGTRSEALDAEVCKLLYKTGCKYLVYAPESASEKTLVHIKKRITLSKLIGSMSSAINEGIITRFNIVIGFPSDTRLDIYKTLWFILKMAKIGATDVFVNIYSPYPGSELYDQIVEEGKIKKFDDEYFHSLEPNNVFSVPVVITNNHIPIWELVVYRTIGYMSFYLATYLTKPSRIFKTVSNLGAVDV